jgi:hypothetical protein
MVLGQRCSIKAVDPKAEPVNLCVVLLYFIFAIMSLCNRRNLTVTESS